ncbi:MAG: hypothetical protein ABIO83_01520 [Ilumatobacteraceae bacterium]
MPAEPTSRGTPGSFLGACILAIVAMIVVACGGKDPGPNDAPPPVGAAGYSAAIAEFLPPEPADGTRPVVYIARLGGEPFPLEVQIELIAAVEETHDLRFVDDIDAAVDVEETDAPARDDGMLMGVGTIAASPPHVVRIELYTDAGQIEAHKVTLSVHDDVWRVDTTEPVDPEVLVGDQ